MVYEHNEYYQNYCMFYQLDPKKYEKVTECLIFLNSGGVSSKTFYIPMNNFLIKFLDIIDQIITKIFPKIFAMGRRLVLIKK